MTVAAAPQVSYWANLANSYQQLGWPFRPSPEDLRLFEEAVAKWAAGRAAQQISALMLGVTRDIATMRWPESAELLGVDKSGAMVSGVWPGDIPNRRSGIQGDWFHLPRPDASCDIVIGDGSMNCVRYPGAFRELAASVRRVLRDDGIFILRTYVQSPNPASPDELFAAVSSEPVIDFHHFKFRLLLSMQRNAREGICVSDVYRCWAAQKIDRDRLVAELGWRADEIDTMENYRGSGTVHTFPTLDEFRDGLCEVFEEPVILTPSAALGERCPILVLRPRQPR
jgi:SAM-dependent methyltransferase